jgi:hypothetical protein
MNEQTQKVTGAVTTANALKMAGYDLDGVIADVEKFDGFDDVCLQTIKRVRSVIDEALEQPAWQGLTSNELEDIKDNSKEGWYQLVRNVEQELKTKNGFSDIKENNT